jgi:arsenate reductase
MLTDKQITFETVLYLETPPAPEELQRIVALLELDSTRQLIRTGEAIYKELELANISDEQTLLAAMSNNPKLIERPILVGKTKAAIGRPLENITAIL